MKQAPLLRRMAKANCSQSEMAAALDISTDTLRLRLRELGLLQPDRDRHTLEEMQKAYDEAGTSSGAAKILSAKGKPISRQAVHQRLVAAGYIKVREPQA